MEITQTDDRTVLVLLELYAQPNDPVRQTLEPRLVGRIVIEAGPQTCHVLDAMELDGQSWGVQWSDPSVDGGQAQHIFIRPHADEAIALDRSFGSGAIPNNLKALYQQQRYARYSLIMEERLLRSTPEDHHALRDVHAVNVRALRNMMHQINARIANLEAARGTSGTASARTG